MFFRRVQLLVSLLTLWLAIVDDSLHNSRASDQLQVCAINFADAMFQTRQVARKLLAREQAEGAGAVVHRSISSSRLRNLDPFLMLDEGYMGLPAGFPDHPHRGFETVTYVLPTSEGGSLHEDFLGNKGELRPGDLQWMTAGRGVMHAEMPAGNERAHALQLWINLLYRGGGTAYASGLKLANEVLSRNNFAVYQSIVVFSDGLPFDLMEGEQLAKHMKFSYAKYGLQTFTVGFGSRADMKMLERIANKMGSEYCNALTGTEVKTAFYSISAAISSRAGLALLRDAQ